MSDKLDTMPELTLTPTLDTAAAAAPQAPELTLTPQTEEQSAAMTQAERDANAVKLDESRLTEAERKMVDEFAQKIDITDANMVLQYGAAEEYRRFLGECPQLGADQGPGRGGPSPLLSGGGAQACGHPGGEEGGHLWLLPEKEG